MIVQRRRRSSGRDGFAPMMPLRIQRGTPTRALLAVLVACSGHRRAASDRLLPLPLATDPGWLHGRDGLDRERHQLGKLFGIQLDRDDFFPNSRSSSSGSPRHIFPTCALGVARWPPAGPQRWTPRVPARSWWWYWRRPVRALRTVGLHSPGRHPPTRLPGPSWPLVTCTTSGLVPAAATIALLSFATRP